MMGNGAVLHRSGGRVYAAFAVLFCTSVLAAVVGLAIWAVTGDAGQAIMPAGVMVAVVGRTLSFCFGTTPMVLACCWSGIGLLAFGAVYLDAPVDAETATVPDDTAGGQQSATADTQPGHSDWQGTYTLDRENPTFDTRGYSDWWECADAAHAAAQYRSHVHMSHEYVMQLMYDLAVCDRLFPVDVEEAGP